MTNREKLLKQIQVCCFVLIETGLYLDSHPNCKPALAYFQKYAKLEKDLKEEFRKKYGGLTQADQIDTERWTWVDNPWPWELEV